MTGPNAIPQYANKKNQKKYESGWDNIWGKKEREITEIIVHCSASDAPIDDSIDAVRTLHTSPKHWLVLWEGKEVPGKGFLDVGYHYFIQNDGTVEGGRDESIMGAHCYGRNAHSIGICLSGNEEFSKIQFYQARKLIRQLMKKYGLTPESVKPHNFYNKQKSCPNFDISKLLED